MVNQVLDSLDEVTLIDDLKRFVHAAWYLLVVLGGTGLTDLIHLLPLALHLYLNLSLGRA